MSIVVFGAGQIGKCVAFLLAELGDYQVIVADNNPNHISDKVLSNSKNISFVELDVESQVSLIDFFASNSLSAVCCCLPYSYGVIVAKMANKFGIDYFDLTEDYRAANNIRSIFSNSSSIAMTQCGLAPGYVDMLVHDNINSFQVVEKVEVRTGALPQYKDDVLHHACTWSVDGLINEYVKDAECIIDKKIVNVAGLSRLKNIVINDQEFETFSTSGGIGALINILHDKANNLEYKTIRYRGHCEKMLFLLDDLKLRYNLDLLKEVLLYAMPVVKDDKVIVDIEISGETLDGFKLNNINKCFVPKFIQGHKWLAIQWTTASSVCAVIDMVINNVVDRNKIFCQDQIPLDLFLQNRFGQLFA